MADGIRLRKLPTVETHRLFPDMEPEARLEPGRECPPSRSGRHARVDLSGLRYRPTPPFCAWCGAALEADRSA